MALEQGWTHKVNVVRRPVGAEHFTSTEAAEVGCRIYPLSVQEVQAFGAAYSTRVSHKLTCSLDCGVKRGDKLVTTHVKSARGWDSVSSDDQRTFDVIESHRSEGGPRGANHVVGLLSEASESA